MATIKDIQELMERSGISPETVDMIIAEMRRSFPGEKIYVAAPDTSKKQQVMEAAKRLPAGVVSARFGVSTRYVNRLIKRR